MYKELGGYIGYRLTPVRELLECRLSIIAEMNVQGEEVAEVKQKQSEQEGELERRLAEMKHR